MKNSLEEDMEKYDSQTRKQRRRQWGEGYDKFRSKPGRSTAASEMLDRLNKFIDSREDD